jgi:two-component system sensor kinase FixL
MMDKAAQQVLRAGAIIRNLREFVEKRETNRAPEMLNKVVEESIALGLVGMAHLGIRTRLELEPAMPPVLIDKIQIQQVLINLIRNGIEAMQEVGMRELVISTATDGAGFAQVSVRDSGPGLPKEVQQRLFQPFVTTKDHGMGIGLNICRSIVEAHGGSIVACAVEPSGTCFRFRLPIAKQAEAAA